jgi:hypothetical protein
MTFVDENGRSAPAGLLATRSLSVRGSLRTNGVELRLLFVAQ